MQDEDKPKERLISELRELRKQMADSEKEKTERKRAEEALVESEDMFNSFLEQTLAGFCIVQDGVFKYVNPKFGEMFGYTVEECLNGMSFKDVIFPEDLATVGQRVQRLTSGEDKFPQNSFRGLKKNGQIFDVEVYGTTSVYKGRPAAAGTLLDITKQRQAQEALRETTKRLADTLGSIREAFFSMDDNLVVTYFNAAAERMLNRKAPEVLGRYLFDAFPEARGSIFDEKYHQAAAERVPMIFEAHFDVNPYRNWYEVRVYPQENGISVYFQIITERKQAEKTARLRLALFEFSFSHSLEELLQKTFDEVGALTNSPIGFYHVVESGQKTLSLQVWSTRTEAEFCRAEGKGTHYPVNQAGVWGDCVRERRPVIHNDYEALPHRKGMAEWHAAVIRELVVPIMRSNRIVGILGFGNKPENYTEKDLETVSCLADVAWEIIERKRAEEELRESEQRFTLAMEATKDGLWDWNLNTGEVYYSPGYLAMLGYAWGTVPTDVNTWSNRIHPDDKDAALKANMDCIENRCENFEIEFRMQAKNGEWRWILGRGKAADRDENGRAVRMVGTHTEITERKKADEALLVSEERYRRLFEDASLGMFRSTLEGRIIEVNPACAGLFGFNSPEDMKSQENAIDHYVDPSRRNKILQIVLDSQGPVHKENIYKREDGSIFTGNVHVWVTCDRDGKPLYLEGFVEDITERKQAEEAMLKANRVIKALSECNNALIHAKDELELLDVICRVIVEVGGYKMAWVGYAEHDADRTVTPVARCGYDEGYMEKVNATWNDTERGRGPTGTSIRTGAPSVVRNVGQQLEFTPWREEAVKRGYASVIGLPVFAEEGCVLGSLTIYAAESDAFDTHEVDLLSKLATNLSFGIEALRTSQARKQIEIDLQTAHDELELRVKERTAALEKANEELRQIPCKLISVQEEERKRLASELHDSIGQTLAAVKFWIEMVLNLRVEGNDNAALNHLEKFVPILQRSIEETRNIYMGLRPTMLDDVGLLAAIEWLRQETMKLYPQRHVEFEAGVTEEEIPDNLKINIFRISQEALNNVAKHSRAEWVDISLSKNGGGIELVVFDDGVGMDLDHILQTRTAASLGLTSMRERAELTGGSFSIESSPGKGTTIRASWQIVRPG